MYTIVKINKR